MANPILNLGNNEWATKSESLLGYSKSGSNFKPVPFTHSRASIGTTIDRNGVLQTEAGNIPRIDFKDNIKGSLLLEPQSTNLQLYSEDFSNSVWTKSRITITNNDTISPNGELTAAKVTGDGTGTTYVYDGHTLTNGVTYTISIFVKKIINISSFAINVFGGVGTAYFNLVDKTVNSITGDFTSAKIEDYGNGWLRCSGILTLSSSTGMKNVGYGLFNYNGDQYYIWGAQVKQGGYPTSYIQTEGSTVTRLKDECKNGGNADLFNDSEGVVFLDLQGLADVDATNRYITLSDGTATNSIMIQYRNSGDLRLYNGGTGSANLILSIAADLTERKKIAIQYGTTANNYKAYINGASQTISGSFSATSMSGLDRFRFDYVVDNLEFFGKVYQAMVFNEALSDSELQTLTTL